MCAYKNASENQPALLYTACENAPCIVECHSAKDEYKQREVERPGGECFAGRRVARRDKYQTKLETDCGEADP